MGRGIVDTLKAGMAAGSNPEAHLQLTDTAEAEPAVADISRQCGRAPAHYVHSAVGPNAPLCGIDIVRRLTLCQSIAPTIHDRQLSDRWASFGLRQAKVMASVVLLRECSHPPCIREAA